MFTQSRINVPNDVLIAHVLNNLTVNIQSLPFPFNI